MDFDERIYQVALSLLPGIGPVTSKKLVHQFGTAKEVFRQKKKILVQVPYVNDAVVEAIRNAELLRRAEKEIAFAEKKGIRILFYNDDDYPERLRQCYDSPAVLFYEGNAKLSHRRIVGIVGTRKVTAYGEMLTKKLVETLSAHDVLIVSGLAYGVDILAHREALENNIPTIGVLAHGLDTLYPHAHKSTARKMVENGGLLCDYPSGTKPDKENFPMRNRIVAGLCDALVVIESGESGGSLITAEFANNYNRDVFAFPGRIGDAASAGCHRLIKTHRAHLIESAEDMLKMMGWVEMTRRTPKQSALAIPLEENEERVIGVLREKENAHADEIVAVTGLEPGKVATALLGLEFAGLVKALPGKLYCCC